MPSRLALFTLCVKGRSFPGVGAAGASSDLDTPALCQVFTQPTRAPQVLFSEPRLGSHVGGGTNCLCSTFSTSVSTSYSLAFISQALTEALVHARHHFKHPEARRGMNMAPLSQRSGGAWYRASTDEPGRVKSRMSNKYCTFLYFKAIPCLLPKRK